MDEMNNNVMDNPVADGAEPVQTEPAVPVQEVPVEPAAQAQAAMEAPAPQVIPAAAPVASAQAAVAETQTKFTPEEQAKIDQFAQTIDVTDSTMVLQYGSGAQAKLAEFSESALNSVKTQDLGQVGDLLTDLVTELNVFQVLL